jgi:hypothetical protein
MIRVALHSGMGFSPALLSVFFMLSISIGSSSTVIAQTADVEAGPAPACCSMDRFFEREIWAKVAERKCLKCHNSTGDAADTKLVLNNVDDLLSGNPVGLQQNLKSFLELANTRENEQSRLLLKATGGLEHGGGKVLEPESPEYRILADFVNGLSRSPTEQPFDPAVDEYESPPFFQDVSMMSPERLLRRVTLSLAGRLPTPEEIASVQKDGMPALEKVLDAVLKEDAFYVRLKEGFNDVFLTLGIEDNADAALLSYEHFEQTRFWIDKYELNDIPEDKREPARWKLSGVYRDALLREPLELIAWIVKNDRPFTELVTADHIMVSPYTARGYGIFEEIKGQFKNAEDPFEYIPARLNALKDRSGATQESATGLYPHAGFLSMFHYLHRYPSTETNRNRLRARMFYLHFLGVDVMELAPRVTDAAAVSSQYAIPTMQAADCVVCHRTIDPVAGLFQDYNFEGHIGPRKEGWYSDMFVAGFEGEDLPAEERWRAPQWLGERTAKDPRFPVAMVEHVYYILMGRKVLPPPQDIEDSVFGGRRRAWREQRRLIESTASRFVSSGFNLKEAFKAIILSDFYRVDGLTAADQHPQRQAELDDLGVVRMLIPEQLERKLQAVFGRQWGRLDGDLEILYGGIDSITVTERNADPGGAMGAIQRILANDVACYHTARDFRLDPSQRLLFPGIEPTVVPGDDVSNARIRDAIRHLYRRVMGREVAADDPDVDRTFQLFADLVTDAKTQPEISARESWFCGGGDEFHTDDPQYTIRAWRGVLTYLMRQHEFLYE